MGIQRLLAIYFKPLALYLVMFSLAAASCKNTSPRPKYPNGEGKERGNTGPSGSGTGKNSQTCLTEFPYPGTYALSPAAVRSVAIDASISERGYSSTTCAASAPLGIPTETDFSALNIQDAPSPNYSDRGGSAITGIVIHNTIGRFEGALSTLRNPNGADQDPRTGDRVSAHMLIGRDGRIAKLVDEKFAAWHAMQMNKSTLGIELEAWEQSQDITPAQEKTLTILLAHWMNLYSITRESITTHREHVATSCPSLLWTTELDFLNWKSRLKLP